MPVVSTFLRLLSVRGYTKLFFEREDTPLARNHRRAQYEWVMDIYCTREEWKTILFTDVSSYCLDNSDKQASTGNILDVNVRLCAGAVGDGFILMDNDARVMVVQEWNNIPQCFIKN